MGVVNPIWPALVAFLAVTAAGCGARTASPPPTPGPSAVVIPVTIGDFTIEPRRFKLKAAKVKFQVTNRGAVDHDFHIPDLEKHQSHEQHLLTPGETKVLEYDLEPGTYEVLCTIPGHREAGMTASLEVVP